MAAEAALSYAVQTLGNLLVEKVQFLRGVEGEVLWLKDELKRMQSFLKDAAEKQANDERVRHWISEIRELALDSQDAMEMFILNVQKERRSMLGLPGKFVCFPFHLYHINKVGEEIECIRKRLRDVESSRLTYGILQDPLVEVHADSLSIRRRENVERRRRLAPWEEDKDVVGLDEDMNLLLRSAVLKEDEGLCIATIVGIGGIGKSTLARKLYNRAVDGFECRAWVVVSSEFTPEDIIKQIMLQLQISLTDVEPINNKLRRQEMLQEELYKHLVDKIYFIVLDDVWEQSHWESLKSAFPHQQDKSSRLLVTSRNKVIVSNAHYVHEMKCLGPEDSWNLFLKKALIGSSSNGKCPDELEQIGRKIVERCGGLPLAISVVGGLLLEQRESISGWTKVLKGIDTHLGRAESRVQAVLELSYQNLAPQLKSCFLFLSLLKEDASIPAKKLVHIWVAMDLVLQEDVGTEETMEDVARGYLDELINRNLLQIECTTKDGRVKTCRIHDLLRELSIEKAKEEINLEILKEEGTSHSFRHPRHCATYCNKEIFVNSITNTSKHLRSLFVYSDWEVDNPKSYSCFKSCELLRVLDVGESFGRRKWPNAIGGLIGLRYLAMDSHYYRLPRSFSKLENLQVLHFPNCDLKVPNSMWKKESLRHLKLRWGFLPNPHVKIQMLKNIQTLGYLRLKDSFIEQLTKMPGLRKLGLDIQDISDACKFFTTLGKLENLIRLHLRNCYSLNMDGLATLHRITQLKLCIGIRSLPTNFPPNLSYLTLSHTELEEDPMPVLEKLPNLLYLNLYFHAYEGEEMEISHGGFLRLKQLYFFQLHNLRNIKVGEGAMPQLQRWNITYCSDLETENVNLPQHLRSKISYE